MQELEPTWGRVTAVCWLMLWRGIVGGTVLGAVMGFIIGLVGALLGFAKAATTLSALAGVSLGLVWWLFVVRMALRKQYDDFRIALVPR